MLKHLLKTKIKHKLPLKLKMHNLTPIFGINLLIENNQLASTLLLPNQKLET
jgi:hypothetical protein